MLRLGTDHSLVVSGDEGLDELSLAGGNEAAEVKGGQIAMHRISAADAGLPPALVSAIQGGDPGYNTAVLRRLLQGEQGAYRDAVLLNAAGGLMIAGTVERAKALKRQQK